jgi:hypothetical protein
MDHTFEETFKAIIHAPTTALGSQGLRQIVAINVEEIFEGIDGSTHGHLFSME